MAHPMVTMTKGLKYPAGLPAILVLQIVPPMTGPTNRASDTVLCARPFARPTTCGGDIALMSTMIDVYPSVPPQYRHAVMIVNTITSALGSVPRISGPTGHREETSRVIGGCDRVQKREGQVSRDVKRASEAEHLEVGEPAERRAEAGVQPELVDELEYAHQGDQEGELGGR